MLCELHFNMMLKITSVLPRDIYTPLSLFLITAIPILFVLTFSFTRIEGNLLAIINTEPAIRFSAVVLMFSALLAASLPYIAMQLSSNDTMPRLMDITFPIFVALIAWLLFKQNHLDWSVSIAGLLILAGLMLIIWKHG